MKRKFEGLTVKRQNRNFRNTDYDVIKNEPKNKEIFKTKSYFENATNSVKLNEKDNSNNQNFRQACKDISRYFQKNKELTKDKILIPSNTSTLKLLYSARRSHSKALVVNAPLKNSKIQLNNYLSNDWLMKSFLKNTTEKHSSFKTFSNSKNQKNTQNTFLKDMKTLNDCKINSAKKLQKNKINKFFENIMHLKSQSIYSEHLQTFYNNNHKKMLTQCNFENMLETDKSNFKHNQPIIQNLLIKAYKNESNFNYSHIEKENKKKETYEKKKCNKTDEKLKPKFLTFFLQHKKLNLIQRENSSEKYVFLKLLKLQEMIEEHRKKQLRFYLKMFKRNAMIRGKNSKVKLVA